MIRQPPRKLAFLGLVVVGLAGVVGYAAVREATAPGPAAPPAPRPLLPAPRPAPSAAEEAYGRALWSIHEEVKGAAFRMTMGGLNYKIREIDRGELRARIQGATEVYRRAEGRVRDLDPPAALRPLHEEYLAALGLYQRSAAEMLGTPEDGRDEHLVAALPLSQEASRKLLVVGAVIWPGEYVPN